MTAPIRVALFGLGHMGKAWRRVLLANPRFSLIATVDPVAPEASHRDLKSNAFDAAIVATPTPTHYAVVRELLRHPLRGILVEKPIATTAELGRILASEARHLAAVTLAVGHVERFNPAVRALAAIISSGRIGRPIHISCTRVGGYPAAVMPGNNVSLDLAVHDLDLLSTLLEPLQVVASVCHASMHPNVCDTAEILLSAAGGASATVHVNWISPCKVRRMHVTGTGGVAFVDLIAQTVELAIGTERIAIDVPRAEPLALQADAFADLIDGKDPGPLCGGWEAAAAVRLAEQALAVAGNVARAA